MRDVDFIEGLTYKEVDLNLDPCIFPQCGHFLTIQSMDGLMDIRKYYDMVEIDEREVPMAVKSSLVPFSMDDIKKCATCRGSLRDLARYGRLVRRAILDESMKKFILWVNGAYVPLAQDVLREIGSLSNKSEMWHLHSLAAGKELNIKLARTKQIESLRNALGTYKKRWTPLLSLRNRLMSFHNQVTKEEQPYNKVRQIVEIAQRRRNKVGQFHFDESVLQTKGAVLSQSLLLRLDISFLTDLLWLRDNVPGAKPKIIMDLKLWRSDCRGLLNVAESSQRPLQLVEAYIYLAQLYSMERWHSSTTENADHCQKEGKKHVEIAKDICTKNPTQTKGMLEEIEQAEKSLRDSTFYTVVSSEERMAVVKAMATEFHGTGHWYYCENGHPFTIGECGMPMQLARCPECNAQVGGQQHRAVDGITHATDLEAGINGLRIG